jgi:aspartate/methionine/tyrosine aminotransferase
MDLGLGHGASRQCSLRKQKTMASFSDRSHSPQIANAFSRALAIARASGTALLDLSSGNPTEQGLGLREAELRPLLTPEGCARYEPEPLGLWPARQALASELARLGYTLPASQIMLTASTSEAYGFLFKLLCDRDDVVLVPEPSYPLLEVLAQLEGVRLARYALRYDGEWHIDADSVRACLAEHGARARAIVCVNPNNPTGSFLKPDELALLAGTGLPLISDEVFADYALQPSQVASALAASDRTLVFRLSGLSKQLALPQLKLAYTAIAGGERAVAAACARLEHIADAYLSPATPVQLALADLLAQRERIQQPILRRVREHYAALVQKLAGSCASVLHVEAGWYAIVRLPNVQSDEHFCLELLEQSVVTQPGYYFDLPESHLVLSLIVEPRVFEAGIALLRQQLDRLG